MVTPSVLKLPEMDEKDLLRDKLEDRFEQLVIDLADGLISTETYLRKIHYLDSLEFDYRAFAKE